MISTGSVLLPVELTDYLNSSPLYASESGDIQLELANKVYNSGDYFYQGIAAPIGSRADLTLGARDSYEAALTIPEGSYLVSITAYSEQEAGFKFSMFDKGAKTYMIEKQLGYWRTQAGVMIAEASNGNGLGPYWLESPLIVMPPGALQIQITNLSANANMLQVMMGFAVPVSRRNLALEIVRGT